MHLDDSLRLHGLLSNQTSFVRKYCWVSCYVPQVAAGYFPSVQKAVPGRVALARPSPPCTRRNAGPTGDTDAISARERDTGERRGHVGGKGGDMFSYLAINHLGTGSDFVCDHFGRGGRRGAGRNDGTLRGLPSE